LIRLDGTVAQSFGDSVDFDRATIADTQGIGGPSPRSASQAGFADQARITRSG
jgi:hypothetical protein